MKRSWRGYAILAGAIALLGMAPACAEAGSADYAARLQAQLLLQTLNATLLSHNSATAVLQDWCDAHGPLAKEAGGLKIVAQRVRGAEKPLPEAGRAALGAAAAGVRYRRVLLACGAQVLSEADNWYQPASLTPEMNRLLDQTETPFGVAVRALDFHRRNLSAQLLYAPLQPGWEKAPPDMTPLGPPPPQVLQHSAVLSTPSGAPFSYVVETYTGQALSMAMPPAKSRR